jgi:hypothetical protein
MGVVHAAASTITSFVVSEAIKKSKSPVYMKSKKENTPFYPHFDEKSSISR